MCQIPRMSLTQPLRLLLTAVLAQTATAPSAPAQQAAPVIAAPTPDEAAFPGYVQLLAARARAEGVSEATIQRMIAGLTPNPRVVALDRSQPGTSTTSAPPPFSPYLRTHVDPSRINGGRAMRGTLGDVLPQIEQRYGVPVPILLAIWGHETNYGRYTGDFDLARSLATLAFEGRRRELFADEFIALLKMVDHGVPRERLYGSWAGAFGNPQFLPSVYLRLAQDGDGDGDADIWHSKPDTLASIANYFRDSGWRPGQPWGVRASVPAALERAQFMPRLESPVCARVHARFARWKSVAEWKALGIVPQAPIGDQVMASLFEPDGPGTPAYLLTGNYKVILEYNCSNYYALSVGLLADEIAR